jgi:hypothetical protein
MHHAAQLLLFLIMLNCLPACLPVIPTRVFVILSQAMVQLPDAVSYGGCILPAASHVDMNACLPKPAYHCGVCAAGYGAAARY